MTDDAVPSVPPPSWRDLPLERKVALLSGRTFWRLPGEPAVGLREIVTSDGPVGVRGEVWDERDTSLTVPSPTALAASWDPDLAEQIGALLAAEARRKDVDVLLAPTVNIHRSPLGGRHFESYSEDPLLTATIGVGYVRGVQGSGVAATVKHYVANDAETDRRTVDNRVQERALREVYLAPFEAIVRAGVWAVMSAYNGVNGAPMTENPLLAEPLKGEWGFDGVVVSDWFAVYDTVASARAAQDLEMPGPTAHWGDALVRAVRAGEVDEADVDAKLERLLRLAARVGALEGTTPAPAPAPHDPRALIRRAAAAGAVLVANDGVLPLDVGSLHQVAVLGPAAVTPRIQGGGSAGVYPADVVPPLDGLRAALAGRAEVVHATGVHVSDTPEPLDTTLATDPSTGEPGVGVRMLGADGRVVRIEHRLSGRLLWLGDPDASRATTLEVSARVRADRAGRWTLAIGGTGEFELDVDGATVFAGPLAHEGTDIAAALFEPPYATHEVELAEGQEVLLVGRYAVAGAVDDHLAMSLAVRAPRREAADELAAAVELAAASDVAVVVVGTSDAVESEGFDRRDLALPGAQDELVRRVAAVNPRTVVVVNSGAPVLLPWRDEVAAVLLVWFPGQEAGDALADVLLGRVEPGGRLPTTWPATGADVPVHSTTPTDGVLDYTEGIHVGYRAWLRADVTPAYPFGFGLGYTTWELAELAVEGPRVAVTARNTGSRPGRQVVQVYLSRPGSDVDRPVRWLAGYAAVRLDPGASGRVVLELPPRAFEHWDGGWRREPGPFTVHVGTSVLDLPLAAETQGPTTPAPEVRSGS